jgi:PIN domain nuclease of toxin-antitoxin system
MCNEPGADAVSSALSRGAMISAVNLAEALETFVVHGRERPGSLAYALTVLGVRIRSYHPYNAERQAQLRHVTGMREVGFGGRACMELSLRSGRPILTADPAMLLTGDGVGVRVRLIRD